MNEHDDTPLTNSVLHEAHEEKPKKTTATKEIYKKLPFPNVEDEVFEAVIAELFRFSTRKQAENRLKRIQREYWTLENPTSEVITWIQGFKLTPTEEKKGFAGNFAVLDVKPIDEETFTLVATKVEKPLAEHPEKQRPKRRHPNWAHPIMQQIRKKIEYDNADTARQILDTLHRAFPDVSIPGIDRLSVMVYSKSKERTLPVQKILLRIFIQETGKAIIEWSEAGKKKITGGSKPAAANTPQMLAANIAATTFSR